LRRKHNVSTTKCYALSTNYTTVAHEFLMPDA
jgi:hypothetical protein